MSEGIFYAEHAGIADFLLKAVWAAEAKGVNANLLRELARAVKSRDIDDILLSRANVHFCSDDCSFSIEGIPVRRGYEVEEEDD